MAAPVIPDLWPQSFGEPEQAPPVVILKQQGILLGQKTANLVYGEVQSRTHQSGTFGHVLEVVAPFLAFRRPLVVVHHHVDPYPAQIGRPDLKNIWNHFGMPVIDSPAVVNSAAEFAEVLRSILQSEETVKLLQALISQSSEPVSVQV